MIDLENIIKRCLSKSNKVSTFDCDLREDSKICANIPKIEKSSPYKKYIVMDLTEFSFDIYFMNENDMNNLERYVVLDSVSEKEFNEENIEQLVDEYINIYC